MLYRGNEPTISKEKVACYAQFGSSSIITKTMRNLECLVSWKVKTMIQVNPLIRTMKMILIKIPLFLYSSMLTPFQSPHSKIPLLSFTYFILFPIILPLSSSYPMKQTHFLDHYHKIHTCIIHVIFFYFRFVSIRVNLPTNLTELAVCNSKTFGCQETKKN